MENNKEKKENLHASENFSILVNLLQHTQSKNVKITYYL